MSILMDALKQQQPTAPAPAASAFWRNLAIALALLLAIGIGFVAGYFLLPHSQQIHVEPGPVLAEPKPLPAAVPVDIANLLTTANVPESLAVTKPAAEPVVETLPPEPAVVSLTTNTARAEPEPEVPAELRERFASALAQSAESNAPSRSALTTHSAPAQDIGALDLTLQRQIPKLKFEAHVYATQPAQRWVKVNGKSLQEGQWITADVRLKEITPQYVLLEYGQQLFSMRALSEW